jgi:hypothetical protein
MKSVPRPDRAKGRDAEQQFLNTLLQFTRSARQSQVPEVARAAREWERVLVFRIRVSLQQREKIDPQSHLRIEIHPDQPE